MEKIRIRVWNESWGMMVMPNRIREYLNDARGIYGIEFDNEASDGFHQEEWMDEEGDGSLVFMQSMHLKDKNGREIFDGDIILRKIEGFSPVTFLISYDKENGRYRAGNIGMFHCDEDEVIGNYYQNPELV